MLQDSPFNSISSTMRRWKINFNPPNISNFQNVIDIFNTPDWEGYLTYSQGKMEIKKIDVDAGSAILMYGVEFNQELGNCSQLYFDNSCQIVPQFNEDNISSFSIYTEYNNHVSVIYFSSLITEKIFYFLC